MNSVGIVCQKRDHGWKIAVFYKERVIAFNPKFSGHVLPLADLRKIILTCAINGHNAVVSSPPFNAMLGRALQDQLSSLQLVLNQTLGAMLRSSNDPPTRTGKV